eukprot:168075-Chlamydomonas_euryale.AAC.1
MKLSKHTWPLSTVRKGHAAARKGMFSHSCHALRHLLYPHLMTSKTIPWHTRHRRAVRDVHAPKGED